jgi:hypothetical protein
MANLKNNTKSLGQRRIAERADRTQPFDKTYAYSGRNAVGTSVQLGLYDEMLKTNPTVVIGFLGLISSMLAAEFDVVGAKVDPKIKEFVRETLFHRMDRRFKSVISTVFKALIYGVAPHEVTFKLENDGLWYFKDLAYRPLRGFDLGTITKKDGEWWASGKYLWTDAQGKQQYCEFGAPGEAGKGLVWWPIYGESVLGDPLSRPMANEHKEKEDIRKARRMMIQKSLFGTPYVQANEGCEFGIDSDEVQDTLASVADSMINESSAIYSPGWVKEIGQLFSDSDAIQNSVAAENHADIAILQAFGSQQLARGLMSPYGSNAAGGTDADNQQQMRIYFYEWLASSIQDPIDMLIDINFGPQIYYPEIKVISTQGVGPAEEVRAYTQLVSAQNIAPSAADEDHFRRLFRWPDRDPQAVKVQTTTTQVPGAYDAATGDDTRDNRALEYEEQV